MIYTEKPKFIIKTIMQKTGQTGITFDSIVTKTVMENICKELTGCTDFEYMYVDKEYSDEFQEATYNQGRLAILLYKSQVFYITFSDEKCEGRNSGIQSVPTAFNRYFMNEHKDKQIYFYFVPCSGNNATEYYLFMYRLMKTAGFGFLNVPPSLEGRITSFSSIDDIIRARSENASRNSGNSATYIVKNGNSKCEIYGKTYGANKYDTSLICYAISKLANTFDKITLYEYNEKDLKELPQSSLAVIRAMGKMTVIKIDKELEKREFENNNSYRSPRFTAGLLNRLGEKHCVLCSCGVSDIIEGAHLWPVADIKKEAALSDDEKLEYATDSENGLWMCLNHHGMFDSDIILLSPTGEVSIKKSLSEEEKEYVDNTTTIKKLPPELVNDHYKKYIERRYNIAVS